jgi:hypothetical protein
MHFATIHIVEKLEEDCYRVKKHSTSLIRTTMEIIGQHVMVQLREPLNNASKELK